ncbi:TPA: recombinase family protein [Vibrio cholerae]|uniref:recombinase family protein n=1 Tax=Vibrio TaxID=662 RepID=UPI000D3E538E|nr:recombinase family protein [Vibrio vulnificus]EKF9177201.1 recombinase family protein [Vibrio cholerae]PVA00742.1 hypothetical protein DC364_00865 [Vibrio vulnificus]
MKAGAKIYLYFRYSDMKQENGDSIRRQRECAQRVADKYKLEIDEESVITDRGVSAFYGNNAKKGNLAGFLKSVEQGEIEKDSILIVESFDRLSRDAPRDAHKLFDKLIDNDITIITENDGLEYNKETLAREPSRLFMMIGTMLRAHEESLTKQKRAIESIKGKVKEFRESGNVKSIGTVPHWLDYIDGSYVLNSRAENVKLIIDMYLNNEGLKSISRKLAEKGIKSPTGKDRWGITTIRTILDNKALYGFKEFEISYLVNGRKVKENFELESFYPSLISKVDYLVIQEKKNARSNSRESYGEVTYLLSSYGKGKSVCAKCGYATGTQTQKQINRKGKYMQSVMRLHCKKHSESGDCCKSFKCAELEKHFIYSIYHELDPEFLMKYKSKKVNKEGLKAEISEIDRQIKVLVSSMIELNNADLTTVFQEKLSDLNEKKIKLSNELNQTNDTKNEGDLKELKTLALKCLDVKNSVERKKLKNIIMQVLDKIVIDFETKSLSIKFTNGNVMNVYFDEKSKSYCTSLFRSKIIRRKK